MKAGMGLVGEEEMSEGSEKRKHIIFMYAIVKTLPSRSLTLGKENNLYYVQHGEILVCSKGDLVCSVNSCLLVLP